ncbi:MFS transporter [Parasphingorhabdus sp.]|uniref:MFS transporter n=1 Tax=Parasphingorhabdus sp. TaxID=2709688 RepID=UPI002F958119
MARGEEDANIERASAEAKDPKMPFLARFSFGFGAISTAVKNASFGYLLLYYNQVIGIPAVIVSSAIAATLIIDALVDPFVGRWSDMTRSRIGRRHPFILGAAIPTGIFFILLWFPPAGLTDLQTGIWIFVVASLTRVAVSAYDIPSTAMVPELTGDYAERTKLFSLRFWFGYVGTFAFVAFSLSFFFVQTPEHPVGQLNPDGYVKFAFAGGFAMMFAILACGLGTLNQTPRMRQADKPASSPLGLTGHLSEILIAFRHRSFLAIFGFGVFKFTAIGMAGAMSLYFNTYIYDLSAKQIALLAFEAVSAATLAAPFAPFFSRKLGKRRTAMLMAMLGILLNALPLILVYFGLFFPSGDTRVVPTLLVLGTFSGAFIAISLINTSSMLADVVEDYAVKSGKHLSGVFFSASSFMQQCSAALGVLAAGLVLAVANFPKKANPQTVTREMELSLLIHYVPTILILWLLGCLLLFFYDIDQNRHRTNVGKLRALEAERNARQQQDAGITPTTL